MKPIGEVVDGFLAPVAPLQRMGYLDGNALDGAPIPEGLLSEEVAAETSTLTPGRLVPVGYPFELLANGCKLIGPNRIAYLNGYRVRITSVTHEIFKGNTSVQIVPAPE